MNFQEAMALLGHTPDPNEDDSAQPGYKFVLDDKYEVVMVKHPAAEQLILYANICPLSRLKLEDYKKLLIHGFLGINPKGAAFGIDEQQDSLLLWKHISSDFIGVAEILEAVNSFASKVIFYFDHFADEQELDDGQDAEAAKAEAAATPQVSEDEMFTALQTLAEEEEEEASELEEQPDPQTTVSTQEVLSNLEMLDGGSAPHSSEEVLSKLDSIGGGATSHSSEEVLSKLDSLDGGAAPHSSEEVLSKLDSLDGGAAPQSSEEVLSKLDSLDGGAAPQSSDEVLSKLDSLESSSSHHSSEEMLAKLSSLDQTATPAVSASDSEPAASDSQADLLKLAKQDDKAPSAEEAIISALNSI